MPTTIDLKIGLNLTIGSVPIALDAHVEEDSTQTVYTFNGCVQDAKISFAEFFSYVGLQFGVAVVLPPELSLSAQIDYIAGQIIQSKAQTEMGIAGQFTLTSAGVVLQFYADSITPNPAPKTGNPYVIGAAIQTDLRLANLPLVGSIPGVKDYGLSSIGFSYTNTDPSADEPVEFTIPQVTSSPDPLYTRKDPQAKNATTYSISSDGNNKTFQLHKKGFSLTAGLVNHKDGTQNSFALPLNLPALPGPALHAAAVGDTPPLPTPTPYSTQPTSQPSSPVHWIKINKTFGPVTIHQIGLNYSQGEATFGLNAGFTVGGFSMDMEGLTITFPMPLPGSPAGNRVSFDLAGLALDIQRGNMNIGGAFMKVASDGVTQYLGAAVVQVGNYGFKAMGGYSPSDPASFFLYVNLEAPIGGPPFLFITGLAGGFGIHRSLILPTIDELPGYLLLPGNAPAQGDSPSSTMQNVLPEMQKVFLNTPGQYWVAAGIQFTSFEMIHAFALVTVAFGVDLQIALLGTCSMTLPTGDPNPIAYIEIDLLASFNSSSGLLAVQGKLSPASYLYGGFCKLTGGFAFFIWFSGPHQGDFVVTAGGYHPAFIPPRRPAYYPDVPRLGMSFGLGPFQVVGQSYYALTPGMMMAGVRMSATWNTGPVSAWLDAGMDFLLSWAPFHYEADAYICVGCSVDLGLFTISAHVGADLSIWGPPFGGSAEVDLDVTSFTISFGASPQPPAPVGWSTFKTNFLPKDGTATSARKRLLGALAAPQAAAAPSNIIKASVAKGLQQVDYSGFNWIINPDDFTIVTNSTVPANNAEWVLSDQPTGKQIQPLSNVRSDYSEHPTGAPGLYLPDDASTFSSTQVWNPTLNIVAMEQNGVQSFHTVQLRMQDSADHYSVPVTWVSIQPMLLNSSAALWATAPSSPGDARLLLSTLTGIQITPIPRHADQVSDVPLLQLLFAQGYSTTFVYQEKSVDTRYTVRSTVDGSENLVISVTGTPQPVTLTNQGYVLSALADPWVSSQRDAILSDLSNNGFSTFTPGQVNVAVLASKTALVDWPIVKLLGDI
jgi:hypothetical protein